MSSSISPLRLLAIGALGYLLIALGQILVLEVMLGGQLAVDSPPTILVSATLGTIVSGLVGGYVVARMGGARPMLHVSIVLLVLTLDTIFVITSHDGVNPLWFELGGAFTLLLATAGGGWLQSRSRRSEPAAT